MELTLYDARGRAIAYVDNGRHFYAFSGPPLAYIDDDSVYTFPGQHLGWWGRGWVRDHHGACVFFTEVSGGIGPSLCPKQRPPAKVAKQALPMITSRLPKPVRPADAWTWSRTSGSGFFLPWR